MGLIMHLAQFNLSALHQQEEIRCVITAVHQIQGRQKRAVHSWKDPNPGCLSKHNICYWSL